MCGRCDNGLIEIKERHPYGSTFATETLWELCDDLENGDCPDCDDELEKACEYADCILGSDKCKACWAEVQEIGTYKDCDEYEVANGWVCPTCEHDWTEVING